MENQEINDLIKECQFLRTKIVEVTSENDALKNDISMLQKMIMNRQIRPAEFAYNSMD